MTEKRGGAGRGQGRKPLAKTGELMRSRPVRMTDDEWEKCKRLGGAAWVRAKIKSAREFVDKNQLATDSDGIGSNKEEA